MNEIILLADQNAAGELEAHMDSDRYSLAAQDSDMDSAEAVFDKDYFAEDSGTDYSATGFDTDCSGMDYSAVDSDTDFRMDLQQDYCNSDLVEYSDKEGK